MPTFPGNARAFPWTAAMRFGLGQMRLAPAAFWAMSLPELTAALEPPGTAASGAGAAARS